VLGFRDGGVVRLNSCFKGCARAVLSADDLAPTMAWLRCWHTNWLLGRLPRDVGCLVGCCEGCELGTLDGYLRGCRIGWKLGSFLGFGVGRVLGCLLYRRLGYDVCSLDDYKLGCMDGCIEGY
jgi:hypothetical protein